MNVGGEWDVCSAPGGPGMGHEQQPAAPGRPDLGALLVPNQALAPPLDRRPSQLPVCREGRRSFGLAFVGVARLKHEIQRLHQAPCHERSSECVSQLSPLDRSSVPQHLEDP